MQTFTIIADGIKRVWNVERIWQVATSLPIIMCLWRASPIGLGNGWHASCLQGGYFRNANGETCNSLKTPSLMRASGILKI